MKKICFVISSIAALFVVTVIAADTPKPKHVNRAIELLEQGQPIYYTGSHDGTEGSFEQGVKDAQTRADYISYDMEHAPFDVKGLADYMRGLAQGGPTKTGHRTPAVIVNVPVNGIDEVSCTRQRVNHGISKGRRRVHGAGTAARIWGATQDEYLAKADAWPLNQNGELLLGLKLEDKYALANAEENVKVPGIAFAEWGRGDMALSLGSRNMDPLPAPMMQARAKVLAATKAQKIFFLNTVNPANVVDMIKEGVMIGTGSQRAAEIGRTFTKRPQPW